MITFGNPPAFKYDSDANMLSVKIAKADHTVPVLEDIVEQLQHVKQANVALSGGLDSQFALRVAKHLNVPTKAYTYLAFWEGSPVNGDDVQLAIQVAKKENIEIEIVELDLKEFLDNDKHIEYGKKYKTRSPQIAFHLYFIEQTFKDKTGTLFLGGEMPMMVKDSMEDQGPLDIAGLNSSFFMGNSVSYRNLCKELNIDIVRDLLLYTPGIIYKTLKASIDIVREKKIHSEFEKNVVIYSHKIKYEIYEAILPGGIDPLVKNTGFERIKKYLSITTGIYNQFDLLYRKPLEQQVDRIVNKRGWGLLGTTKYIAKNLPQELTEEYREAIEEHSSQRVYEYYYDF